MSGRPGHTLRGARNLSPQRNYFLGTIGYCEKTDLQLGLTGMVAVGRQRTTDNGSSRPRNAPPRLVLTGVACGVGIWLVLSAATTIADIRQEWMLASASLLASLVTMAAVGWLLADRCETSRSSLAARNAELTCALEGLRFSESRLRDLAEISSEWFWEQDAELRYTWFSHTVRRPGLVFDLIGQTRWETAEGTASEEKWAAHKAQLAGREAFRDFRYVRIGEDGEARHISVSGKPVFDEQGEFCGYRGAGRETTAEVRAAEALLQAKGEAEAARAEAERQRERLVDAIESISEGFALFDRDDRYVMTNTNYRSYYADRTDLFAPGMPYADMMRRSIERGRELDSPDPEAWIRRMVQWHQACAEPLERQLPDGRWIRAVERRTSDGGIVALRTDITERKEAEEALRVARDAAECKAAELARSERRFRDFAMTSSHWLWETDTQHRFCYVSEGVSTFGFSAESLVGRTRLEIAVDAGSDVWKWQRHHDLLQREEPFRDFFYRWKNAAGIEGVAAVSGDPVFDAAGGFLGYRGTGRDITEQVRVETAMREAKQSAETANLAKSQFLANMSHELRTPLNGIIGFSEMIELSMKGPLLPAYQDYAKLIHQSGEHLCNVINDILDLAKVDAGKFELRCEPEVDPVRIAEACLALMRGRAEAGGIELTVRVGEPLPPLVADPTRLKQILLNLLSNAIRFTNNGGLVTLGVRPGRRRDVIFEVRDNGCGMTAAEVEIALEPFGQIDADFDRRHEGTGLGLPLSRRLAELHGGSLSVDSAKGRGTTVTVVLPAAVQPEGDRRQPAVQAAAGSSRPAAGSAAGIADHQPASV
jgi:PAS domain S-box-containing protein